MSLFFHVLPESGGSGFYLDERSYIDVCAALPDSWHVSVMVSRPGLSLPVDAREGEATTAGFPGLALPQSNSGADE